MRLLQILSVVALVACAACASYAATDRDIYIFQGGPLTQGGITTGGWGSGKASESSEKVLTGSKSIKVIAQGLYSGGRLDFAQPVPLFTEGINSKRYIVFSFYFDLVDTINPGANTIYAYDVEPYTVPKASTMRFVFVSDTGAKLSVEQPTNQLDPDTNWCQVAVPLEKFKVLGDLKEFKLKRLLIFSDLPNTFYLGEIKLMTDSSPIRVDSLGSQVVAIYDEVLFVANADGGVSSLKYTWDFDSANGIQQESTGKAGRYIYLKGGDFTVTLTVSDVNGLKSPVTITGSVNVID